MRTAAPVLLLLLALSARPLAAAPSARPPAADRARILAVELRRGPAAALEPFLAPDADPALRRVAVRALGRIGDRAGATEWLLKLLGGGAPEPVEVLRAAGLNRAAALEGPVARHLASPDPAVVAAAAEALGWIGGESAAARLPALLHRPEPAVVAATLDALARCRQEAYLERVLRFLDARDPGVRRSAAFAAWFLAGARKKAVLAAQPKLVDAAYPGDLALALALLPALSDADPERRLDGLRPLGLLAPAELPPGTPLGDALDVLLAHADVRVVHEAVARVLATRPGKANAERLARLLAHADPQVRQAAVEALGEHGSAEAVAPLKAHGEVEADDGVRQAMAVALIRAGRVDDLGLLMLPVPQPGQAPDLLGRRLRVLARWKGPQQAQGLVAAGRLVQDRPPLLLEVLDALGDLDAPEVHDFVAESLGHADPYVRAAAVGVAAKRGFRDLLPRIEAFYGEPGAPGERDLPQAVVEAWADLLRAAPPGDEAAAAWRERLLEAARSGPTFTARAAARKACAELKLEGAPTSDPLQPNDWRGLPRPKEPVLGLDLTQGQGWLEEAEIVALADRLEDEQPGFVVETSAGAFRLVVDPAEAPVHAVSFLLNVVARTYDGTPWHRVVPSFVIQGGDPHGTGNGDAGHGLPDEITRAPFLRGALGMPKGEIPDTGGCQLFVMHSPYRPLDGRYTCYGRVVDGLETVDRIRVGDRIRSIRLVQAAR